MLRKPFFLIVLVALLVAGAAAGYAVFVADTDGAVPETEAGTAAFADAHHALLATPQQVDILLSVDVWTTTDRAKRVRQEITALGEVDFESGDAELLYDFESVSNAAGLLGDLDTMDMVYDDGTGYLEVLDGGRPWLRIEPEDASNRHVLRLREVMLTTPMMLPGLLEIADNAAPETGKTPLRTVEVTALTDADDDLTAGIGSALEEIEADEVRIAVTRQDQEPSEISVGFTYPGRQGETEVEVTYALSPLDGQISAEAPPPGRVQSFSSLIGT